MDRPTGCRKYTTEVVLQRYRGELTLLGSRNEGAATISSSVGADQNSIEASGVTSGSAMPPMAGDDFDDDIPF